MAGGDTIRGHAGADFIDGGAGPDRIAGGTGSDRLFGGPDADTICASNGSADLVNGGTATDHAVSDSHDTLVSVEVHLNQCPFTQ